MSDAKKTLEHMMEHSNDLLRLRVGKDAEPILRYFEWAHLPLPLAEKSRQFGVLAVWIVETLPKNAERTVALRKLLEAKDAAVRAALPERAP